MTRILRKSLVLVFLSFCQALVAVAADDFGPGLEKYLTKPQFWRSTGDEFISDNPHLRFSWLSGSTRTVMRCMNPKVTFAGIQLQETLVQYQDGKPHEVRMSVFNRGDGGAMFKKEFAALVEKCREQVSALFRKSGGGVESQRRTSDVRVYRQIWRRRPLVLTLSWSETEERRNGGRELPYRAEYVRISVTLDDYYVDMWDPLAVRYKVETKNLGENVKRTDYGDVYVRGVPMVDQGEKGYCAVSCMERLFRYYGVPVDQHEVAQLAESSASGGTSPELLIEALERMEVKFRVRVKKHFTIEYNDVEDLVDEYNSLADDEDLPEIQLGTSISLNVLFSSMKPELLAEARQDDRNGYRSFMRDIEKYVKKGVPLLWSVIVGIYPEEPPVRGLGGHMRLIIGYNEKTGEVIYSDTWGNGHELKRMPASQAWAITMGLLTAESRDAR